MGNPKKWRLKRILMALRQIPEKERGWYSEVRLNNEDK